MRNWMVGLAVSLFGCMAGAQTRTIPTQTRITVAAGPMAGSAGVTGTPSWIGAAPAQTRVMVGSDGQTYIGIWVDTPNQAGVAQRAPVDLALVIDNSGSMAGDKIVNARMAASSLLETMADGDIVSVYTFSNDVVQIAPPTVIEANTRALLMQAVGQIQPTGGTNLYAGMQVGEATVGQAPATHPVRRVVVISDGQANIGPSSPEELGNLAAQGSESGAQVSAIGVGMDYDERTLAAMAVRSSGRFYHLAQPGQMAGILREELARLSNTVATDAYIEIVPAPGVQILGSETVPGVTEQGHLRVRLGSLFGGQHREVLVRARIDTAALGDRPLGAARLVYKDPAGAHAEHAQAVPLQVGITRDASVVQRSVDARVAAMVTSFQASQAQIQAVALLNEGNSQQAAQVLGRAEQQLRMAVAAAPPSPARERLAQQAESVGRGRSSASRATSRPASRASALDNNASAYSSMGY